MILIKLLLNIQNLKLRRDFNQILTEYTKLKIKAFKKNYAEDINKFTNYAE